MFPEIRAVMFATPLFENRKKKANKEMKTVNQHGSGYISIRES